MPKIEKIHTFRKQKIQKESKAGNADKQSNLLEIKGLIKPPIEPETLLKIKESNPIHAACITTKSEDMVSGDYYIRQIHDGVDSQGQVKIMEKFFKKCNHEHSFQNILRAFRVDYDTFGMATLEVVKNGTGTIEELHYVPVDKIRAHKDKKRFAQIQADGITHRWFKRFGVQEDYNIHTGEQGTYDDSNTAGELIILRRLNNYSSFYGYPEYASVMGTILGSIAVRDYNIDFFSGRTIPDTALIIEGADVSEKVEQELKVFFSAESKQGLNHKLVILPLPGSEPGEENVRAKFEKLTPDIKEASFRLYRQDNSLEICIAHRVPPYRIGWAVSGSLGGSVAEEMDAMYKKSVIKPGQKLLEDMINEIIIPAIIDDPKIEFKFDDIDEKETKEKTKTTVELYDKKIISREEAREELGYDNDTNNSIEKADKKKDPGEEFAEAMTPWEKKLEKVVLQYFKDSNKKMYQKVSKLKIKVKIKKEEEPDPEEFEEIIDVGQEQSAFVEKVEPILQDIFKDFIEDTLRSLEIKEENEDILVFDPMNEASRRWIDGYVLDLARGIVDTTQERLREEFRQGWNAGESSVQIARRLQSAYDGMSSERALLIARTETAFTANMGKLTAYRAAGVEKKRWYTALDERVCKICEPMHDEIVGIDKEFSNGLQAPPAHPRCRCTIMAELSERSG